MEHPTLFPSRVDRPVSVGRRDAIRFQVSWDWEADTKSYWLAHWVTDPITNERLTGGSNRFKWNECDAVGDSGLVVRWIREARAYLLRPEERHAR